MIEVVCDAGVAGVSEQLGGTRLDRIGWRNDERPERST